MKIDVATFLIKLQFHSDSLLTQYRSAECDLTSYFCNLKNNFKNSLHKKNTGFSGKGKNEKDIDCNDENIQHIQE